MASGSKPLIGLSIVGEMLHALVDYTARPAGSQIVAYLLTFCVIVGLSKIASNRQQALQTGGPARDRG
ncbi:hypothetical protein [Caballeronia sp. J97]|uniref:hypothetical protein n=1 Tax=Caballeronia sp. J97 TaxID=2805429 RepID=UPI0039EE3EB4